MSKRFEITQETHTQQRTHSAYRCRNLQTDRMGSRMGTICIFFHHLSQRNIQLHRPFRSKECKYIKNAIFKSLRRVNPPPALIQSESYIKHHIQCRLILWQGSSCDSQPIKSRIVEGLFLRPTAGGSKVAFADEAPTVASGSPRPGALNYGISSLHSKARICSHEFVMKTWRKNKAGLWQQ